LNDQENVELSYTNKNLFLFASYNHLSGKQDWNPKIFFTVYEDTLWQQSVDLPQINPDNDQQLTAGLDWAITQKQAIGGQYQGTAGNKQVNFSGTEDVWANGTAFDKICSRVNSKNKSGQHIVNTFYIGNYTENFNLRLDMDYLNRHNKTNQKINEFSNVENRNVTISGLSDYHLFAAKLTMEYHLKDSSRLEFGGEYNQINGSGFLINPEQYIENNTYTNEEKKAAGFVIYSHLSGKLHFQAGIRYEFVDTKFTEDSTKQVKTDGKQARFYPNLSISQAVGKTQMGLSFSRKIKRPSFSLLYQNNDYTNRLLTQKKNPYLLNEDIYSLDYYLKQAIFDFTLGYIYKKNPIAFTVENVKENTAQSLMTYINYPDYHEFNALLTANFNYKAGQSQINAGLRKPFFNVNYRGETLYRNRTSFSFDIFNDIILPKEYIISVHLLYQGKLNYYVAEYAEYKTLELGLRKTFLNDKLSVHLQADDVFKWLKDIKTIKINTVSYVQNMELETRFLTLTISYRFNNPKKIYRGKNASEDDIKRL
jgi:hypothetical protein